MAQLILIPLEEIESREAEPNPNRRLLGRGPEGTVCRDCAYAIDRGKPYHYWDWNKRGYIQAHSHKRRCTAMEGTLRERALKLSWDSCIYFKEKGNG
jgi:hypothetical protein